MLLTRPIHIEAGTIHGSRKRRGDYPQASGKNVTTEKTSMLRNELTVSSSAVNATKMCHSDITL